MENMNDTNVSTGVESTTTDSNVKTYTQAEVDALIQREGDRRVTEALKKQERKTADKIREAEKLASMDANEKYEYELQKREAALAEKEQKLQMAENKSACMDILADKNIPVQLADLVVDSNAECMNERIKMLEKCFNDAVKEEVKKRLTSTTPKSGNSTKEIGISKEAFKKMSIVDRQKLYDSDRELYNILSK